jgi:hypothetical protein
MKLAAVGYGNRDRRGVVRGPGKEQQVGLFKSREEKALGIFRKGYKSQLISNLNLRQAQYPKARLYPSGVWPMHMSAMRSGYKAIHDRGYRFPDPEGRLNKLMWEETLEYLGDRVSSAPFEPDFLIFNRM